MHAYCSRCVVWLIAALTASSAGSQQEDVSMYDQRNRAETLRRDVSFADLPQYKPAASGTRVVLDVCEAVNTFDGVQLRHRSYNNSLVGPTIRVRPGALLEIRVVNHLLAEPANGHGASATRGYNTTNLHTHGLHVSPQSPADDVFREITPGQSFNFQFQIPADHPAGTFWYHPHKHGSTALQLASGMAGALIVEGGLDSAPGVREADEKVLVIQQFFYRPVPGESAIIHPDDVYQTEQASPDAKLQTAINGQVTPTIVMRPGEVQRWRIVDAGIHDPLNLKLPGMKLFEIAVDGLTLGALVERDSIELHPGYRSDVLVQAPLELPPAAGNVHVMTTEVSNPNRSARGHVVEATDILKVVISGPPKIMALPRSEDLRAYAPLTDADVPTDAQITGERIIRMAPYTINDHEFEPDFVEIRPEVETAEKWKLVGATGGHPFHIHVNPFAVPVPSGDQNPNKWLWRDTLFVERGESKAVTMRTWFRKYTGKTVIHCHMLDHEDLGLMQAIEIVSGPSAAARTAPAAAAARSTAAPAWAAVDSASGEIVSQDKFAGKTLLMVLHRGVKCVLCAEQLALLAERQKRFERLGIDIVAICPFLPAPTEIAQLRQDKQITYPLLVDASLATFEKFKCVGGDGVPQHGLFLIEPGGRILWQSRGDSAETDVNRILSQCLKALNDFKRIAKP